jgi:hypothetical protein
MRNARILLMLWSMHMQEFLPLLAVDTIEFSTLMERLWLIYSLEGRAAQSCPD